MAKIKKSPRVTTKKAQVFAKISRDSRPKMTIPKEAQRIMSQEIGAGRGVGYIKKPGRGKQIGMRKRGKGISSGFYY